jgi:hypothetical protein
VAIAQVNNEQNVLDKRLSALQLYPDELTDVDNIGSENYVERVLAHFGARHIRGSAVGFAPDGKFITRSYEPFLRSVFSQIESKRSVEIGTLFGVTTALLAHYAEEVVTIDMYYQQMFSYLTHFFGVAGKIRSIIIDCNEAKKEFLDQIDFDFAFIDAEHTYDGVKFDFECVKKCGRVLFHDYGLRNHPGVTEFINELPGKELYVKEPFAYWEKS